MSNADNLRKYRVAAEANGMCQECRCRFARDGLKSCTVCSERRQARARARKQAGRCACGRWPAINKRTCASCLENAAARAKLMWGVATSQDMCGYCWNAATPGTTMCERHHQRNRDSVRRAYAKKRAS